MTYLIILKKGTPAATPWLFFPDWEQVEMIISIPRLQYLDVNSWKEENGEKNWKDLSIDHL